MVAVMQVGYARVSTQDQNLTIQRERLACCERLFEEKASSTTAARPALQACLDFVKEGDTLTITRLDGCLVHSRCAVPSVAGRIACTDASLFAAFSCAWSSPAPFDKRRDIERPVAHYPLL
jgi:Resolvase, N terminal domain